MAGAFLMEVVFNPYKSLGVFAQNYLKSAPIENKVKCPKLKTFLVLLTIRSCS
jgi:hypothetical protein